MTEAVIRTEKLTKHFRHPVLPWIVRSKALTDLSLSIEPGEAFALLGPNGSGKSTTIKLLLGLNFPTSGSVSLFGESPSNRRVRARIGYLPEETYLYPYLSPREILDFYGRLFSLDRAERARRIDSLLTLVGLSAQRDRAVGEFSKGMQRRVALAQCLINNPELVILDEPTTGMDAIGIAEIKDLIRHLRELGKTIVMCSHRMADVEDVCDRLSILYGGHEQVCGTITDLVEQEKLTQITASLSTKTLEGIRSLIRENEGDSAVVDVAPAKERLEQVFLRVVRDAQDRHVETSGAGRASMTGADFLTSGGVAKEASS